MSAGEKGGTGPGRGDGGGAAPEPPTDPATHDGIVAADTTGLPLPNSEGSTLGEGRDEETDAVGKGPRDAVIDRADDPGRGR